MVMSEIFRLVYQCKNCNSVTVADTTDGVVTPPPEHCLVCMSAAAESSQLVAGKRGKTAGTIINGLKLDLYNRSTRQWRVQCLFCCQYVIVPNNNISKQKSCGCIKGNTLQVVFFYPPVSGGEKVRLLCRECGLEADYLLTTGQPITCKSGCIGKAQLAVR